MLEELEHPDLGEFDAEMRAYFRAPTPRERAAICRKLAQHLRGWRTALTALEKAIEGLRFIKSKQDEEGWDLPGVATEFLAEVEKLLAEKKREEEP